MDTYCGARSRRWVPSVFRRTGTKKNKRAMAVPQTADETIVEASLKQLPSELTQLILEYERSIILHPHPTAIIMNGYFRLGVFGSCVFGVYGVCPFCNNLPFLSALLL